MGGALALSALVLVACDKPAEESPPAGQDVAPATPELAVQGTEDRVAVLEGFSGPESVRYDPGQDVWFVGNFNGEGGARNANGFVSRVSAETGVIEDLRFAQGTAEHPLHAPRGMFIVADTLWVADIDGVHAFDRHSGVQHGFVDLTSFEPGFLNDIAQADDGALYVTDTGRSAVYRIVGRVSTEALAGEELGNPNGITWDPARGQLPNPYVEAGGFPPRLRSFADTGPTRRSGALREATSVSQSDGFHRPLPGRRWLPRGDPDGREAG
jgi:hypothetical protein